VSGVEGPGVLPHAAKSRKGMVPYNKNKVNQDRAVVQYNLQSDAALAMWGVMDGHGEFGHFVAAFIQEKLPQCLANQDELRSAPEKAITEAVKRMCDDLTDTNINVAFSGSTCVFGVKISDMLYVANVGDSRCVMVWNGNSHATSNNQS
jgi:serine/threonine protein phosphatase PrpC